MLLYVHIVKNITVSHPLYWDVRGATLPEIIYTHVTTSNTEGVRM